MTAASFLLPLWNRAAEWERRLTMIREARAFVYLSTYYIEHDAYSTELLAALAAAQRRGVAVNLLIDGFVAPEQAVAQLLQISTEYCQTKQAEGLTGLRC